MNLRRPLAAVLTALALLQAGCNTMLASDMPTRDPAFHRTAALEDQILAFGQLGEASLKALGTQDALAFLGEKHTYLIVSGGDDLRKIVGAEVARNIQIGQGFNYEHHLELAEGRFWGDLRLSVPEKTALTDAERAELKALGFAEEKWQGFTRDLRIEGLLLPATQLPDDARRALSQPRSIRFYPSRDEKAPLNLKKVAIMPMAVTADVVTAPLQIVAIGSLLLYIELTGWHMKLF